MDVTWYSIRCDKKLARYRRFTTRCTPNTSNYSLLYRQFLYKVIITILCRTNQSRHARCRVDHFYPCYTIEGITWEIERSSSRVESSRGEAKVFHRGWVKKERKRRGNVASVGRSSHESLLRSIALHPILQGLVGGGKVHHGLGESWVREKCMARCTTLGTPRSRLLT